MIFQASLLDSLGPNWILSEQLCNKDNSIHKSLEALGPIEIHLVVQQLIEIIMRKFV